MATNLSEQVLALQQRLDDATQRAESLRRVIESISGELALQPLLTRIIQCAVELIDADDGTISLVMEKQTGPVMRALAAYNLPQLELGHEIGPDVGLSGLVLQQRRPIRLDHYSDLARPALPDPDDYAAIGMPIWWADRLIGFFGIGAAPPRRFDEDDSATLELFARHAAIAIENARRYEREQRRREQLTLIARIGHSLTADLSLDELLQSAADSIHELLVYPNVAIALIDPAEPTTMVLRTFGGAYRTMVGGEHHLPISAGIMGEAARTRQTQLVNDVASDPRYILPPGAVGIRAELAAPMVSGDQVLGVLNLESGDPFSEDDATTIQIIADQLTAAIINARLFEAERQRTARLELIARVGQHIAAQLDPDELFTTTVQELHRRLGYDHASLFLLDPDDPTWLVKRAHASLWLGDPLGHRQSIEDGIMGAAARQRRPELVTNVSTDSRYIAVPGADQLRTELTMPILLGERLLGVLDIADTARLDAEDIPAIQIIVDQLAVAIENARLAERGQQLAVLEERRRLARELHDSVTQSLFSMSLLAQVLPELWEVDPEEARAGLVQIRDLTRSALAEMRALLVELRPAALGEQGLAQALREHVATFERRTGISVMVDLASAMRLPESVEQAFFRITQEALANVARHAQAQTVRVTMYGHRPLRLTIADDGRGFQPEHVADGRFGLISMRERAAKVGALLHVRAAIGQGTTIAVEWPDLVHAT